MPKILFVHQNFPGQFRGLIDYLCQEGWDVTFATATKGIEKFERRELSSGVTAYGFRPIRETRNPKMHRYLRSTEEAVLNAQGFANLAVRLRQQRYIPDIVVAHSGWGSGSFTKAIWPEARLLTYLEWWYRGAPDPAQSPKAFYDQADMRARRKANNLPFMLDLQYCDRVLIPTENQAAQVPDFVREMTTVMHDGVDCEFFVPDPDAHLGFDDAPEIAKGTRVLTYATRGMEPMRGFPSFMEALSRVQKTHPDIHTLIAGTDTVHYASQRSEGSTYKTVALETWDFDLERIHFVGRLPLDHYRTLLQRSNAHVYLTEPFVLSWSLVESMAVGCPLIVSNTPAIDEALPGPQYATHVEHTDIDQLAAAIRWTLDNPQAARAKGHLARARALENYDSAKLYPAHRDLFLDVINAS